jgi:hypothetical protein
VAQYMKLLPAEKNSVYSHINAGLFGTSFCESMCGYTACDNQHN